MRRRGAAARLTAVAPGGAEGRQRRASGNGHLRASGNRLRSCKNNIVPVANDAGSHSTTTFAVGVLRPPNSTELLLNRARRRRRHVATCRDTCDGRDMSPP